MQSRSLILIILIVLLPTGLLTWFGVSMARNENSLTLPDSMCDFDWLLGSFGPQPIEASQEFG